MGSPEHSFLCDDSFKCLFDTYKNRLYGYVLAITRCPYTAEEITQEIFIKLWLRRDILHEVENLDGYIFTVARNKTLNHLRKAAYDVRLLLELQARAASNYCSNNVEERALSGEFDRLLRDALALMSPQRRLVYLLSRQHGMNHEEIAQQLRLSRNTVRNHMVEALRFLRRYFGEHGSILLALILLIKNFSFH